jgi:hypothetical protein
VLEESGRRGKNGGAVSEKDVAVPSVRIFQWQVSILVWRLGARASCQGGSRCVSLCIGRAVQMLSMGRPFLRRIPLNGRFTPLLLDHSEYYFRRLEAIAVLTLPIDSGAGTAAASAAAARGNQDQDEGFERGQNGKAVERRSVKGILHVCGHSVVFEPV